ncbi:2-polyprenyl-6-methoxyphenol hydroxylase [Agromyces sp. CF514]|uniref:FAD-dependent monooxygenase n=1 Tax=Agromyces sp. CF514 TaxID=1881031 RepID=UPI0008F0E6CD|nr:FAD-dependent monooxygenase [Agromyces sp. CF514]SFR68296.1 2-polyprenyl-6-methoxyphenol hydroxylase [Agromyces sp. CF514]
MSSAPRILISGGGIAGNALALQLVRAGIPTTIVERAAAPRPGGQAVDLRGASREAAERLGLMPGIRRHQLDERGMSYVDGLGRIYGRMSMEDFDGKGAVAEVEITRGDLNDVLLDALREAAASAAVTGATGPVDANGLLDQRYGDHLVALEQDADGVDATFASGRRERYDLVVGADGVHSATRRLAFGPEDRFVTNLGGYAAFFTMPTPADIEPGWFAMRLVPGAMFGIRPDADPATSKAIINIRTTPDPALRGDRAAQQALIRRAIEGGGWHAERILDAMERADDFYFDDLARVDMPSLSNGRVVLIGDAATCGSPLTGMGTAMAIVGAYLLGLELVGLADAAGPASSAGDDGLGDPVAVAAALGRFEAQLAPHTEKSRQIPGGSLAVMLPRTRLMSAFAKVNVKLMLSRPMRPLAKKLFVDGGGEELTLPDARAPKAVVSAGE